MQLDKTSQRNTTAHRPKSSSELKRLKVLNNGYLK